MLLIIMMIPVVDDNDGNHYDNDDDDNNMIIMTIMTTTNMITMILSRTTIIKTGKSTHQPIPTRWAPVSSLLGLRGLPANRRKINSVNEVNDR